MMRGKPSASMQKTYDDCYLICSTAVFFESQKNEAEALRSWKSALDQIYYYLANRLPGSYVPRTETERALYNALKQMETQCEERVDLLEALRRSRLDVRQPEPLGRSNDRGIVSADSLGDKSSSWLGDNSVPPMQYSELPSQSPGLPARPQPSSRKNSNQQVESDRERGPRGVHTQSAALSAPPSLPVPTQKASRSPSPDHGRKPMKTTLRSDRRGPRTLRPTNTQPKKPATLKAAGLAWDTHPRRPSQTSPRPEADPTIEARLSAAAARRSLDSPRPEDQQFSATTRMPNPADYMSPSMWKDGTVTGQDSSTIVAPMENLSVQASTAANSALFASDSAGSYAAERPPPLPHHRSHRPSVVKNDGSPSVQMSKPPEIRYRKEYPDMTSNVPPALANQILDKAYNRIDAQSSSTPSITRKPVAIGRARPNKPHTAQDATTSDSDDGPSQQSKAKSRRPRPGRKESARDVTPPSTDAESQEEAERSKSDWDVKAEKVLKNLPKGIDPLAAAAIMNEIVVKGDEVHWEDVAGLELAKKALKEAVVYPFLRPDLFMGLREPARGMLLFGPPGTGKTMLARAVATESKSTFFAISASSLTSKWHGESEKLVRALFAMAKLLAPSIIFVDEIDSLLSSRGGGSEHEASRRSKTEFLIQWSDLQRAAAGKDSGVGDPSRVLVLAATNCPWDIDDAARRRFVRRQYIPLPEPHTRDTQLRALLGAQKHGLGHRDIARLVDLTEGYSGSDITALAKDAALWPLRSLGEDLLFTPMEKIRPICMTDFESSLQSIRPSVSSQGLEEFEKWAREFGERGG